MALGEPPVRMSDRDYMIFLSRQLEQFAEELQERVAKARGESEEDAGEQE